KGNWSAVAKSCQKATALEEEIDALLSQLGEKARDNYNTTQRLSKDAAGRLSEKDAKNIGGLLSESWSRIDAGDSIKALKNSDDAMKILSSMDEAGNYDLILWGSMVMVLAVAAVYYFKGLGGTKKSRVFRRLEKAV
ncbi:MAG: hypothetical protein WC488_03165, partial [Candidatus Micrarchaeia archaeon]